MSTIGQRMDARDKSGLHKRTKGDRDPSDTMDAMALSLGWAVERTHDDRGYPCSTYTRGPWSLRMGWTERGGHGVRGSLFNSETREMLVPPRDGWLDPKTGSLSVFRRSQALFRWCGHLLYDERIR